MKPKEKKPEEVYRIVNRVNGVFVGSYSRAYCNEYDFTSAESARSANCHDMFQDKRKYKIAKYRVTYELIDPDTDNAEETPIYKDGDDDWVVDDINLTQLIREDFIKSFSKGCLQMKGNVVGK